MSLDALGRLEQLGQAQHTVHEHTAASSAACLTVGVRWLERHILSLESRCHLTHAGMGVLCHTLKLSKERQAIIWQDYRHFVTQQPTATADAIWDQR